MSIAPLLAGEISPTEAVNQGHVQIDGPLELLDRFVEIFRIDPARVIGAGGPLPPASSKENQ